MEEVPHSPPLYISNKERLSLFKKAKLLVADFCNSSTIQLANIETSSYPAAEDEAFLAFLSDLERYIRKKHDLTGLFILFDQVEKDHGR